jgi:hypothetical protein
MLELRYNGLFIPPFQYGMYSSIPYIEDIDTSTLFMFITYPGCFNDAYHFAKRVSLERVIIIPVCLATAYAGEIMNLQNKLCVIKKSCKVVFPACLPDDMFNIIFRENYIQTQSLSMGCASIKFEYQKYTKNFCEIYNQYTYEDVEYKRTTYCEAGKLDLNDAFLGSQKYGFVFDLLITVYGKTTYMSMGMDKEKIIELSQDDSIHEIHLPFISYFKSLYGFKKVWDDKEMGKYRKKIKCNAFASDMEWDIFKKHHLWYDGGRYVRFLNFPRQ